MFQVAVVGKTVIGEKFKTYAEANAAKRQLLIKAVAARMANEVIEGGAKAKPISYEIVEV